MTQVGRLEKIWRTQAAEHTAALGALFAQRCPPRADGPAVVYLSGDLGAGKTTFAQGFVRGCGIEEAVRSPTYALLEAYERPALTVLHLDLYRLRDPAELEALGLRDWARPGNLWLIEWPQKGAGGLPPADLNITLRLTEAGGAHDIEAVSTSFYGREWLAAVNSA